MTTVSEFESNSIDRGPTFLHLADDWHSATGRGVRVAIIDSGIDAAAQVRTAEIGRRKKIPIPASEMISDWRSARSASGPSTRARVSAAGE